MQSIVKHLLSRIPFYALFFIFPVLGMMNCDGWNEGSGVVESCVIDIGLLRSYANFYFMFITMSSFMLLLPVLVYILFFIALSEGFAKKLRLKLYT